MAKLAALARLDGVAQAELVARGEVSTEELLDACAERMAALNPLLNAAPVLDFERARTRPAAPGPFSGVPFLIKDVTPYPGLRWSLGSRLFAGNITDQATPYSAKLDEAGLVTVGKSATSEFGMLGSTETLLDGITHNPWELSTSAAGSSGGAAAAVAAGLVPLAHASDGGGSVRIPASVCGLFGFKPSRGRCVSASLGESDFGALVSEHCVSRSVRDSALLLSLTENRDAGLPPVGYVREHDAVLTPTLAVVPWRIGHLSPVLPREELMRRMATAVGYTPIQNIVGCPAMSVPLHVSDDGLPIGTHFAAAPGAEALLLGLAYQLEAARPWHHRWAPYSYPQLFDA